MKMKWCALGSCMIMACSAGNVLADGMYVSGHLGMVSVSDADITAEGIEAGEWSFDTGIGLGAAVGVSRDQFRGEIEARYVESDLDDWEVMGISVGAVGAGFSGDMSCFSVMGNGYFDIKTQSPLTPYVMAGIGMAVIDGSMTVTLPPDLIEPGDPGGVYSGDGDDNVFAYQVGVGAGYAINEQVTLELGYRYFGTSDPDLEGIEIEIASHQLLLGARMAF